MPRRKDDSPAQIKKAAFRFELSNREAARIILAQRNRYAGLPVEWAELWLQRHARSNAA